MSKKPKKKTIVKKELSIAQKEANLVRETIAMIIIASLVLFYALNSYACYDMHHPHASFTEKITGTIGEVMANPLYMFPITYPVGMSLGLVFIAVMFIFLDYTQRRIRVRDDVKTAKGRTEWADVNDIVSRYAQWHGNDYRNQYKNAPLSKNIYISLDQKTHYHNLNTLVLGTAGTGKSRYVLKPNLLQMNCSYVVTDPNG